MTRPSDPYLRGQRIDPAPISGQETVAQALSKSQGYAVPVGQAQP